MAESVGKNFVVAILLVIFLGGLGIHRFYLGHKNTAIAISPYDVDSVLVAIAADELLNISGIFACFVLANINGDIYISGRSVGDINVQVVLEVLGGGGHMNIAGAKLSNTTIDEAVRLLKDAMSKNLRVGDLK